MFSETSKNVEEMQTALKGSLAGPEYQLDIGNDALLYATYVSTAGFFPRRTLAQYANRNAVGASGSPAAERYEPWIKGVQLQVDDTTIMVYQLWIWILGDSLVVTCFPWRWRDPTPEPYEDFAKSTFKGYTEPPKNAYDFALSLMRYRFGVRHSYPQPEPEWQLISRFEQILGGISANGALLLKDFSETYKSLQREKDLAQATDYVESLQNLTNETDLLNELRAVQDELHVLKTILGEQQRVARTFLQLQSNLTRNKQRSDLGSDSSAQISFNDEEVISDSLETIVDHGLHENG
ncbi:hypothetical protein MBLNU13_g03964t1 [Cladosporium sp. NU13]